MKLLPTMFLAATAMASEPFAKIKLTPMMACEGCTTKQDDRLTVQLGNQYNGFAAYQAVVDIKREDGALVREVFVFMRREVRNVDGKLFTSVTLPTGRGIVLAVEVTPLSESGASVKADIK